MMERLKTRRIGILIFPEAQVLDITGPHEAFSMASDFQKHNGSSTSYEVFLIANNLNPVKMSSGLKLQPDCQLKDGPLQLDTLIVPGSEWIEHALYNEKLLKWIKKQSTQVRRLVSVCTGAFFYSNISFFCPKGHLSCQNRQH